MKHFFASADLGMLGLLFFFIFFCVITLWTFRSGAKTDYEKQGRIPLEENES